MGVRRGSERSGEEIQRKRETEEGGGKRERERRGGREGAADGERLISRWEE